MALYVPEFSPRLINHGFLQVDVAVKVLNKGDQSIPFERITKVPHTAYETLRPADTIAFIALVA